VNSPPAPHDPAPHKPGPAPERPNDPVPTGKERADPTPGPGGRPAAAGPAGDWWRDPLEVDRHLDGEGDPAERARRERDLATRPEAARAVSARRAFLAALGAARGAAGEVPAEHLRALEQRVRAALRADRERVAAGGVAGDAAAPLVVRRPVRARPFLVGAAALLAGLGTWLFVGRDRAEALNPYVAMAADVLDWQPQAFETCAQGARGSDVHRFALVAEGELQVTGCAVDPSAKNASVAVLRRPEELPVVGYVAVPATGTPEKGVVGITEVEGGRVVVFDVVDGGRQVYLAVNPASLRAKHPEEGHRWSCAACHGPARRNLPNPHRIVLRRAP
jgi:hypothetical protein